MCDANSVSTMMPFEWRKNPLVITAFHSKQDLIFSRMNNHCKFPQGDDEDDGQSNDGENDDATSAFELMHVCHQHSWRILHQYYSIQTPSKVDILSQNIKVDVNGSWDATITSYSMKDLNCNCLVLIAFCDQNSKKLDRST